MIYLHSDITQSSTLAKHRSRRVWLCALMLVALLAGQWCQMVMAAELPAAVESLVSADSTDHSCCRDVPLPAAGSDDCENCLDVSLLDLRVGWLETPADVAAALWDSLLVIADDGLVQYWRYCETLWSGLSQPIYLLISLFLE